MARAKKVPQQFVVASALDEYSLLFESIFSSQEEAAQEAIDYDAEHADGAVVFKLVPVATIRIPTNPEFTLEPING